MIRKQRQRIRLDDKPRFTHKKRLPPKPPRPQTTKNYRERLEPKHDSKPADKVMQRLVRSVSYFKRLHDEAMQNLMKHMLRVALREKQNHDS